MSSSSNTIIIVNYDVYKTNVNYSICITTPRFTYKIKTTILHTSRQRKIKQNKYIETSMVPQKEIIINHNNNDMSMCWRVYMIMALFFSLFIIF
jgi:hypothetical protein